MEFSEVAHDLVDLVGKRLQSIGGKSDLELLHFDPESPSWQLVDSLGRARSRPVSELETIWEALRDGAPTHVESVLRGSGSSRNQPETLIANLSYVEWARVGGRKHLVYVRRCSHEPATLRRMDAMAEAHLQLRAATPSNPSAVVVTGQTKSVSDSLVGHGYSRAVAVSPRAYRLSATDSTVLVIDSRLTPCVAEGVYPVLRLALPAPLVVAALPGLGLSAARYLDSWVFVSTDD